MVIWGVFAVLTAIAAIAVLLPYGRARRRAMDAGGSDTEVYKDQLGEIEKDLERGALSPAEADAARLEISRRLLRAADQGDGDRHVREPEATDDGKASRPKAPWRARLVLATAFVIVPLASVATYLTYGAPGMPDRPLQERLATSVENQDVAILIARVENALAENPDDARGWAILAPVYARQGRFEEARNAYGQLLRLQGDTPTLLTDLGELIVVENAGLVTEEAMQRFTAALNIEPAFPKARYYRGLGLAQEGRTDEARQVLVALRNDGGPNAPWSANVDRLLADMDAAGQGDAFDPDSLAGRGAAPTPTPSPEAAAAIAALPEAERQAAIEGMVGGLAARLESAPEDLAGWSQLIRAYTVLDRRDAAQDALNTALEHFASDQPARLRLLTIAEELQLEQPQ